MTRQLNWAFGRFNRGFGMMMVEAIWLLNFSRLLNGGIE
jgi:hypothetical protein